MWKVKVALASLGKDDKQCLKGGCGTIPFQNLIPREHELMVTIAIITMS
jgi:hypothetical protein